MLGLNGLALLPYKYKLYKKLAIFQHLSKVGCCLLQKSFKSGFTKSMRSIKWHTQLIDISGYFILVFSDTRGRLDLASSEYAEYARTAT